MERTEPQVRSFKDMYSFVSAWENDEFIPGDSGFLYADGHEFYYIVGDDGKPNIHRVVREWK